MSTITNKYDTLAEELDMLRGFARRLHDEGNIGAAAETNHDADQLEEKLEEMLAEEMTREERALYTN